jgi:DNA-binding MarR family transcriptional regulator
MSAAPGPGASPGRDASPDPGHGAEPSPAPDLLAAAALTTFRLNGQFLEAAERMARPAGLTAAWWQVLGAVLRDPLPVAGVARAMGITRQSVQRIADLLVERGLAEYRPNPAHRTAKLLAPTEEGRDAVRRIAPAQQAFAERLADELGREDLGAVAEALERLSRALDVVHPDLTPAGRTDTHAYCLPPAGRPGRRPGAYGSTLRP